MISSIISNLYLSKKKIFIDGIPLNTTKAQIINFFKQYGEVDYCVINTDKYTNVSRGFGFLIFKNSISVKYCLNDKKNNIKYKLFFIIFLNKLSYFKKIKLYRKY